MRNTTFDALKGLLIVLVVLGHLLLGTLEENAARQVIYFFHMPLFLAVTGCFVRPKVLRQNSQVIITKYFWRPILPYLVAFSVFTTLFWLFGSRSEPIDSHQVLQSILYPYLHLWYVPAVILFVFYTKTLLSLNSRLINGLVAVSALGLAVLFEMYKTQILDPENLNFLGDKRYYCYYYYFLLGYFMQSQPVNNKSAAALVLSIPFLMLLYYSSEVTVVACLCQVVVNSVTITLTITLCDRLHSEETNILSRLGQLSLPIYLWHMLPLLVLRKLFANNLPAYYFLSISTCCAFVTLVAYFENRNRLLNSLVYGTQASIVSPVDHDSSDIRAEESQTRSAA